MSSKAVAHGRQCRAVELVLQGKTYDEIAREVGYANRGTAHRVVAKALKERLVDGIDELRFMEWERLDALQASLWHQAMAGDTTASNIIVRIIDKRCRLLGLYDGRRTTQQPMTLVMSDAEVQALESNTREATDEADCVTDSEAETSVSAA